MSLVHKLTRALRWLRWSTICAILFYVFFIGLILHSTSYKLQHTLKSRQQMPHPNELEHNQQQRQQQQQQQHQQQPSSSMLNSATRNNVLHAPEAPNAPSTLSGNTLPVGSNSKTSTGYGSGASSNYGYHHGNALSSAMLHVTSTNTKRKFTGIQNNDDDDGGTTAQQQQRKNQLQQQQQHQQQQQQKQQHAAEPETVIIAASSVNEKQILEKALKRADKNHDNQLTIQELAVYINRKIVDHIDEAIDNNPREFRRVDISPADGLITWEEYHRFFLKSHGMTDNDIDEHNEIKHTALNRKAREDMMRDKARWSEAARTDLFSLTIDEYLAFRHPESSVTNLLELVDDLLRQFDQDGDDQLTLEEFSEVNVDDDEDLMRKSLISKTVVERREEFKRIIDKNGDGKADRGELLHYVNPRTPRYALQESATIFSLCDENHDGKLTLDEMVANAEIILTSKVIDTANSFHTEF